jgi:hypothetical protein
MHPMGLARTTTSEVVELLDDDDRRELVRTYLDGDLSVDDEVLDVLYLEEEIRRTVQRLEPLLVALRDLHRHERMVRLARPDWKPDRGQAGESEVLVVLKEIEVDAKEQADRLRDRVKDLEWTHGADLARLEILRFWWSRATGADEPTDEPEGPAEGD